MGDLFFDGTGGGAKLSPCGRYRYELWRQWEPNSTPVVWIMLNPSTADALTDDPTIRRCMGFARAWGYGGIFVANLFCLRTPSPSVLFATDDCIGDEADATLSLFKNAAMIVAAWGVHGSFRGRDRQVMGMLKGWGRQVMCLGTTKEGHPRHPLYVRGDTQLVKFETPEVARG